MASKKGKKVFSFSLFLFSPLAFILNLKSLNAVLLLFVNNLPIRWKIFNWQNIGKLKKIKTSDSFLLSLAHQR
jgi:hypothetical protein